MKYADVNKIDSFSEEMQGVFTMSDLKVLYGEQTEATLYKKLSRFTNEGVLIKVKRGIYATPDATLDAISNRINPDSYISTGTVLAKCVVIGSIPARKVQAMKIGRSRVYDFKTGVIEHLSITPSLFFGFERYGGINYATPEKAFLDACYLYFKGKTFSFDLDTDINRDQLNGDRVVEYLAKYDASFIDFFKERWSYE